MSFLTRKDNKGFALYRKFVRNFADSSGPAGKFSYSGFTLMELLIVMAVIGILAGIILTAALSSDDEAKIGRAKMEINQIYKAILQLEVDTGCWPKTPAELECKTPYEVELADDNEIDNLGEAGVGLLADVPGVFPGWSGPYLEMMWQDPWGNNYFFDPDYDLDPPPAPVRRYVVVLGSFGPNGVGPNLYDEDDVIRIIFAP